MVAEKPITGRCYCGALKIMISSAPQTVAYCHCTDCRRLSGAPVAAFAAFSPDTLEIKPNWPAKRSHAPGVSRWFCPGCGSQLAASYDYLPDQVYVPLGILDQAEQLPPEMHSHVDSALSWLHIADELPRNVGSSRNDLRTAGNKS